MIFGYRELIFWYREMCLISRYREINSWYPKIATRQKQVTPPPCNTALPHRPLSSTAPAIPAPSETIITTSVNHSVYKYMCKTQSVQPTIIIQPIISFRNTEICGVELMSLMILIRAQHWDNWDYYMYHYITICIFVEHFDMPFKNRDNNYDKTYESHNTWNPLQ